MADKKKSGFDAPVYGIDLQVPKGHVVKVGPDGIMRFVPAKKKKEKEKK